MFSANKNLDEIHRKEQKFCTTKPKCEQQERQQHLSKSEEKIVEKQRN
jgi:hypothetical protein